MKRGFQIAIAIILCFVLVGCGCSNNKNNNKGNEDEVVNLYTDDTKLVYNNNDVYKMVFYFNVHKEITGCEHYYKYADNNAAAEEYEIAKAKLRNDSSIAEIKQKGKYVVYILKDSEYAGKTIDDIKEAYSYLVPVYER